MLKETILNPNIKPVAKAIYMVIALLQEEGKAAGKKEIMESVGICEETYLSQMKYLVEAGLVEKKAEKFKKTEYLIPSVQGKIGYGENPVQEEVVDEKAVEKEIEERKRTKKKEVSYNTIPSSTKKSSSSYSSSEEASEEVKESEAEDLAKGEEEEEKAKVAKELKKKAQQALEAIIAEKPILQPYERATKMALGRLYKEDGFDISKEELEYCLLKFIRIKPKYKDLIAYLTVFIRTSRFEAEIAKATAQAKAEEVEEKASIAEVVVTKEQLEENEKTIADKMDKFYCEYAKEHLPEYMQQKETFAHLYCEKIKVSRLGGDVSAIENQLTELKANLDKLELRLKGMVPEEKIRELAVKDLAAKGSLYGNKLYLSQDFTNSQQNQITQKQEVDSKEEKEHICVKDEQAVKEMQNRVYALVKTM